MVPEIGKFIFFNDVTDTEIEKAAVQIKEISKEFD
jgi:hypothetical protein